MPKKLLSRNFNTPLDKPLIQEFEVAPSGIHLIKIEASDKAWWQNLPQFLRRFFADDGLHYNLSSEKYQTTPRPRQTPLLESKNLIKLISSGRLRA